MTRDTILFDMNETVLDLAVLKPGFKAAFGDEAVTATWFSMLLHTSTVCALTGVKADFATLADAMLDSIAARQGVELADQERDEILDGFTSLPPHADVRPALTRLRSAGYRTAAFTNSSLDLVTRQIENAGLTKYFDDTVSVGETGSFKPDGRVYRFAAKRLNRQVDECRLIAAHDWDTHGALTAGMLAAYIDRSGAPYHPLYKRPDVHATTMDAVIEQIIEADSDKV
jgi:2-haloacid dehalogenase